MGAMASQITSITIVYSTHYSGADQRKHQSSASLAFVRGIHRSPVNSPHKRPVTRKMFPFDDVIILELLCSVTSSQNCILQCHITYSAIMTRAGYWSDYIWWLWGGGSVGRMCKKYVHLVRVLGWTSVNDARYNPINILRYPVIVRKSFVTRGVKFRSPSHVRQPGCTIVRKLFSSKCYTQKGKVP